MNKQTLQRKYPADWEIKPLSSFAEVGSTNFVDGPFGSDLKVSDYAESGVRVLQLQNLGDGYFIDKNKIYTTRSKAIQLARCIAKPGDLIIAKMAEPLARAAILPDTEAEYIIVADLIKLHPAIDVDSYYLVSFINFSDFRKEADRLSTGTTRTRISLSALKRISLPKPPLPVQSRISEILRSIDNQIESTESLIAKYQQIKAGLMHDLFTRGVTADGKLRPPREQAPELYQETPIGWIPKEWQYELLDKLALRGSGHTPNKNIPGYWNSGVKWISLADSYRLDRLYIDETEYEISQLGIQNSSAVLHPAGIVVLSRDAGVGKSAITTVPMAVSQHFMCWRCDARLDKHFLYYWLQFKKRMFENIAMGSTILTIGLPYFKKLRIAAPRNPEEQKYIGESLKSADEKIFSLEADLEKKQKLKAGLMHDLLTGKVRVKVEQMLV